VRLNIKLKKIRELVEITVAATSNNLKEVTDEFLGAGHCMSLRIINQHSCSQYWNINSFADKSPLRKTRKKLIIKNP
jgi:hypothetical protein